MLRKYAIRASGPLEGNEAIDMINLALERNASYTRQILLSKEERLCVSALVTCSEGKFECEIIAERIY